MMKTSMMQPHKQQARPTVLSYSFFLSGSYVTAILPDRQRQIFRVEYYQHKYADRDCRIGNN